MKKSLTILFLFCLGNAWAQKLSKNDLPLSVVAGFEKAYPETKVKKWELVDGKYRATVKKGTDAEFAVFISNGEWIETLYKLSDDEIPTRIFDFLDNNFKGYAIDDIFYVEENKGGSYYLINAFLRSNKNISVRMIFDLVGEIKKIDDDHVKISGNDEIYAESTDSSTENKNNLISQEVNASEEMLKILRRKFPQYTNLTWSKTNEEHKIALLNFREDKYEAEFDENDELISTSSYFTKKNIPHFAIESTLKSDYSKAKFVEGKKVLFESKYARKYPDKKSKNYYAVTISQKIKGSKKLKISDIIFDMNGNVDMIIDQSNN